MTDKKHCEECAGLAKSKEETCSTCDGEGNFKVIAKQKQEKVSKSK